MEQLVARRAHNPKVVGSSPAPATSESGSYSKIVTAFLFSVNVLLTVLSFCLWLS
jgi:hypothetical protein